MTDNHELDCYDEVLCLEIDCVAEASCYCNEHNEEVQRLRAAIQEFVDSVDKGEIHSMYIYKKFKSLLEAS